MPKWIIDPDHSVAAFAVRHMMIANVHGQFNKIAGTVQFDTADISKTSIEFEIDVAGIYTGIKKRDEHLLSQDFFNAEKHSKITFKSNQTEQIGFNSCKVKGDLTIHGITKTIIVDAEFFGSVKSPFGETSVGITAKTKLNRENFDINWNQPMENGGLMVGKDIQIFLNIEADLEE
jgi:polyisoprenoid-binding protein YceI